jgi:type II secretory ATPase GspE/PulE/Tfp pilus assembly ATPase PilB-like protein
MEELRFFLKHQHGMILVVGPTGSGKSTTLSSAITSIKSGRTNIITIEDPIDTRSRASTRRRSTRRPS